MTRIDRLPNYKRKTKREKTMDGFWLKEWYITPRICIAVANEWLCGYMSDRYGRYFFLGFVALTIYNSDEDAL